MDTPLKMLMSDQQKTPREALLLRVGIIKDATDGPTERTTGGSTDDAPQGATLEVLWRCSLSTCYDPS